MKQRPVGVTIFGSLFLLSSVLLVLSARDVIAMAVLALKDSIIGFVLFVFEAVSMPICGIGVLRLKEWARRLTLVSAGLSLGYGVFRVLHPLFVFVTSGGFFGVALVLLVLYEGATIWYFLRPSVKAQFVQPRAGA